MLSGMVDTPMLSSSSGDQAVGAAGTANTYIGVLSSCSSDIIRYGSSHVTEYWSRRDLGLHIRQDS